MRARRARRHRHPHRRQLLRLLQEGGQDADQLRRQPLRLGRGGALGRRAGLSRATTRARNSAATRAPERHSLADVLARDPRALRAAARGPRAGPHRAGIRAGARGVGLQPARRRPSRGAPPTAGRSSIKLLAGQDLRAARRLPGADGTVRGERGRGAWSAPRPRSPPATSPAPCPAAASRRSPRRISDAILPGPVFVADFERDLDAVAAHACARFCRPLRRPGENGVDQRPILSGERSLGSVIKLLTPSSATTRRRTTPGCTRSRSTSRNSCFVVKRFYRPSGATTGASTSRST